MTAKIFDDRRCELGEGPLWHPERQQFFWFDIIGRRLLSVRDGAQLDWEMPELTSAAGWIDDDTLMVVSETGFHRLSLPSGELERLADLEANQSGTRSNDGRADPFGGYWIGTMGKGGEARAGAIYRYYRGEVRLLFPGISIPNAISFSPDGTTAYFADTVACQIWRVRLGGRDGWPVGDAEVFVDLKEEGFYPDGAVVDVEGNLWNAQWGGSRVAVYDPAGRFLRAVEFPASNTTCPAFGGTDLNDLYCTSALQGVSPEDQEANNAHGKTFVVPGAGMGQAEHRVIL